MLHSPLATLQAGRASGPDLTGYFLLCAGLLAGVGLLAYAFKRLFASGLRERAARRSLQVVDVLSLGGRRKLAVVRCYDRTFVLGMGEKEVSLVAELDLEESPAEIVKRLAPRRAPTFDGELAASQEPAQPRRPAGAGAAGDRTSLVGALAAGPREVLERLRKGGVVG